MPLRLLEARLPGVTEEDLDALMEDVSLVDRWVDGAGREDPLRVRILLDSSDIEGFSDRLRDRCGERDGFRVVLVAVEATIPVPEDEEEEEEDEESPPREKETRSPSRISREELYEDISEASGLTLVYVVMVALSTVVAAVGLIRGDVAIIIGAMVIAPLLGPNIGLSLAATLGDPKLAVKSLRAIGAGLGTAVACSILLGAILSVDPSVPEIADRTRAGLGDIALALSAGAAGSLAFTGGVPSAVVGVMVAVALLPPIVVAGLLAGAGYPAGALGALVLVGVNVACINLSAVGTFLVQKVEPRSWWEADRARKATWIAAASWLALLAMLVVLIIYGDVGVAVA